MILTGLVLLTLTAAAASQDIALTDDGVTLTCSGDRDGVVKWKNVEDKKDLDTTGKVRKVKADQDMVKGQFSCEYTTPENSQTVIDLFYLDVKVCKGCYELSGWMASGVIVGDLLLTGAVIVIVYMCVRKNTGSTQQRASKPRTANAPPVPNPDYEQLNQHTLSGGLYSGLK